MNRANKFERYKITKVSTNKSVCNVYLDAFTIEKVRLQNANYETGKSISTYIDFALFNRLAQDAASGRLIRELMEKKQLTISMGGSKSSIEYDGQPESRIVSLGYSGDKVFINMQSSLGAINQTGLIVPQGKPKEKISVGMTVDDFRQMMMYTRDCVNAYLSTYIPTLVEESTADRSNYDNH